MRRTKGGECGKWQFLFAQQDSVRDITLTQLFSLHTGTKLTLAVPTVLQVMHVFE